MINVGTLLLLVASLLFATLSPFLLEVTLVLLADLSPCLLVVASVLVAPLSPFVERVAIAALVEALVFNWTFLPVGDVPVELRASASQRPVKASIKPDKTRRSTTG